MTSFSTLSKPTDRLEKNVLQKKTLIQAQGNGSIRHAYELNGILDSIAPNAVGLTVIGHLNKEFLGYGEYAMQSVSRSPIFSVHLGRKQGRVGGGKSYDSLADLWPVFQSKPDGMIPEIERIKNQYDMNTKVDFFGGGFHSLMFHEFLWKEKDLTFPYEYGIFSPPTEQDSTSNFMELLSWHEQFESGKNIVFDSWGQKKNFLHDRICNAIVACLIAPEAFRGESDSEIDADDIHTKVEYLGSHKTWSLSISHAENKLEKRWNRLPEWFLYPLNKRKPIAERSENVLADLALRLKPQNNSLVIVLGDFTDSEIEYMRQSLRSKLMVEPKAILPMRCSIFPEVSNCIVGVFNPFEVPKIPTPHFELLRELIAGEQKTKEKESGNGVYG